MRKPTRLRLRNKIIHHLNQWQQLGCIAYEFARPAPWGRNNKNRYNWRLVSGVAKDGRAILIYPITDRRRKIPKLIVKLMMELEGRGALVGCAPDIGSAWDIVFDNEAEHKRKAYTYLHRYWNEKYLKSKGNEE